VYYHIVVRHGQHTTFTGEGPVRIIYYSILGSHIILAALVVPLALFTAYQGLRWNLQRHVRIARWTLPVWIYVSATGVVVYWMLYQAYPAR
jgi:putative membrane protein